MKNWPARQDANMLSAKPRRRQVPTFAGTRARPEDSRAPQNSAAIRETLRWSPTTWVHHMKNPSLLPVLAALLIVTVDPACAADPAEGHATQKVLGIGGLFFKSENPARLAKWYETHLGISPVPTSHGQKPWQQDAGPTAFAPFKKDTKYFGKPEQAWMVDFRVADLKAMIAQLRADGIAVEEPQSAPNGDFARLHDPEGNPIELWQPKESR
jgi:glyoxylase I family protein